MGTEEKRLISKIYFFEDLLLRSKNYHEMEQIRSTLVKLRRYLSKLRYYDKNEG